MLTNGPKPLSSPTKLYVSILLRSRLKLSKMQTQLKLRQLRAQASCLGFSKAKKKMMKKHYYLHIYVSTHMCARLVCLCTYTYTHVYVQKIHIYIYIYIYVHRYLHIHVYTYTATRTPDPTSPRPQAAKALVARMAIVLDEERCVVSLPKLRLINTNTYTYTYTCIYIHMLEFSKNDGPKQDTNKNHAPIYRNSPTSYVYIYM